MPSDPVSCLHQLSKGIPLPSSPSSALIERLATFSTLFTLYLSTLHDAELYSELEGSHTPFTLDQIARMVPPLRDCFITLQLDKHLSSSYRGPKAPPTKPSAEVRVKLSVITHVKLSFINSNSRRCSIYSIACYIRGP